MGSSNDQMTCVGHSLGAHICGMVSNHLTTKQHKIIGKIFCFSRNLPFSLNATDTLVKCVCSVTGLDPARPLIEQHASRDYRLTRDDADSVQIIHTNAGTLGQLSLSGSLDLCINGGQMQPFCRRGFRISKYNTKSV